MDVPMDAKYGDEVSNLKIKKVIGEFIVKHSINIFKRIFYNYYLRDSSLASIELVFGYCCCYSVLVSVFKNGYPLMHAGIADSRNNDYGCCIADIFRECSFFWFFIGHDISSVPNSAIGPKNSQKQWLLKPRENILNKTGRQKWYAIGIYL